MAENAPNKNSLFFSDSGTSPIKKQPSSVVIQKSKTEQMALNAIQDNNLLLNTSNISYSDTVKPKKLSKMMPELGTVNKTHAINYTKDSINDINQKVSAIKSLTAIRNDLAPQQRLTNVQIVS